MPTFATGDMLAAWDTADLNLITANASLLTGTRLVMGAGIAKQVRERWPGIDASLGRAVLQRCLAFTRFTWQEQSYRVFTPPYGLLLSPEWPVKRLGLFQVKGRFYTAASLELIAASVQQLRRFCAEHPQAVVNLNFPGIGCGRLPRETVLPLLLELPATVVIWEYTGGG